MLSANLWMGSVKGGANREGSVSHRSKIYSRRQADRRLGLLRVQDRQQPAFTEGHVPANAHRLPVRDEAALHLTALEQHPEIWTSPTSS
jgi:hypothetical protein